MSRPKPFFILPALLLALPGRAETPAPQAYPTQVLLSTQTTVLNEPIRYPETGPAKVQANIVTIAPGADSRFHTHPAPMFAYILEGEVTVDYGPAGTRTYGQGEALMEAMGQSHRGMNLGQVPVRILSVHMGAEGTANVELQDKPPAH